MVTAINTGSQTSVPLKTFDDGPLDKHGLLLWLTSKNSECHDVGLPHFSTGPLMSFSSLKASCVVLVPIVTGT